MFIRKSSNLRQSAFFCFLVPFFVAAPCFPEPADITDLDPETIERLYWMPDVVQQSRYPLPELEESDAPAVFMELENKEPEIHIKAVYKLVYLSKHDKLGGREKEVIPALRNLLKSEYRSVRRVAAMGLVKIDPSLATELSPIFIEAIQNGTQPELRDLAVLYSSNLRIKEAVPAIIELIKKQKPEFIPTKNYKYYNLLQAIGTPEALEFSYWPLWRVSGRFGTPLDEYILERTWPDFLFLSGFIYLFWRSRRARKSGIKISYRPLLITVFVWGLQTVDAIGWTYHIDYPDLVVLLINMVAKLTYFSPGSLPFALIVGTLAGIIPWLVSFLKLEQSDRRILFKWSLNN